MEGSGPATGAGPALHLPPHSAASLSFLISQGGLDTSLLASSSYWEHQRR